MDRQEILLKEYEVCQHDSSAMISAHWTVTGIFMGISTAVLGWILYSVISKSSSLESVKGLVLVFGVVIIILLILLLLWMKRVDFLVQINNQRMRIIETQLGMSKNRIVDVLDNHWKDMSKEQRKKPITVPSQSSATRLRH